MKNRQKLVSAHLLSVAAVLAISCGTALADSVRVTNNVPVTITNPPASPVFTSSVSDPGRTPYRASMYIPCFLTTFGGFATQEPAAQCSATIPTIGTTGTRVAIQRISGQIYTDAALSTGLLTFSSFMTRAFNFTSANISIFSSTFDVDATYYIDGGTKNVVLTASVLGVANNQTNASFAAQMQIEMTGYVLDCTRAPCAPIVTQ